MEACLWCDGYCDDSDHCQPLNQRKDEGVLTSKCAEKAKEYIELHSGEHSYSDPPIPTLGKNDRQWPPL